MGKYIMGIDIIEDLLLHVYLSSHFYEFDILIWNFEQNEQNETKCFKIIWKITKWRKRYPRNSVLMEN